MTENIEYSTLNSQDLTSWDNFVMAHSGHSPYHLSAWGLAVKSAYNHDCIYCVAKLQGTLVGILPVVVMKVPIKGIKYTSLPFCDLGGALATSIEVKLGLEKYAKQAICKDNTVLELREHSRQESAPNPEELQGKKVSMLLPLPSSSDELMASFKSKLRSQIRKAEKNGLSFQVGSDANLIDPFYSVFSRNMHRLGSPVHSKSWFESILFEYKNNCLVSIVKKDDIVVGAGIVLMTNNKACIPWASTLVEFNRLSPNMLLYWSLLSHCADSGIEIFDFGRSTYQEGTYKFKAQWGAQPKLLNWYDFGEVTRDENKRKGPSKSRKLIEQAWKTLPLTIANQLGPLLRRYISL